MTNAKKIENAFVSFEQVSTLHEYYVLDTDPEAQFDDLARLASEICGTPIGIITLLDQHRQWFKAKVGIDANETPIEQSFCKYAAMSDDIFQVEDASVDDRFSNNPIVTDTPNIRFYAGTPLKAMNGVNIGALCVVDDKPRKLTALQESALNTLARQVMTCLELRKLNIDLAKKNIDLQRTVIKEVESLRTSMDTIIQREQELELATSAANVGIWEWDLGTNKIRMSDIERNVMGFPITGEISFQDFEKIVHPEDFEDLKNNLLSVISSQLPYSAEFRIIKNEKVQWVNGSGRVFVNSEGKPERMVGVNSDITAIKENALEKEDLRIREQAALSSTQLKTEFLANMSHEIRTPINGIIGMTKLLMDEKLSSQQSHFVDAIKTSSNILLVLINDILDLSKIEAGKLSLEVIPFSMDKMLGDLIDTFSPQANAKGLKFKVRNYEQSWGFYLGDPSRILQVLNNLISNALKFTAKGIIEVNIEKKISPSGSNQLEFKVSDTGEGMTGETLSKLFQNFQQADSSTARRFGGSGLGLSISKKLVELMNGKISVESKPGSGSTFSFTLQLDELHQSANVSSPKASLGDNFKTEDREKFRILVAEDNLINQEVVLMLLEKSGYRAHAVANGIEALSAMKGIRFDLILMDCQMPEMDGYEASRLLRQQGHDIPIIALTANAFKEDKDKCLAAGMTDYLTKPIHFATLIQNLDNYLLQKLSRNHEIVSAPEVKEKKSKSIDREIVNRLRFLDEDGSSGLIPKIIGMFINMTPEALTSIRAAHIQSDDSISRKAHALKSSCVNLGVIRMTEILQKLENGSLRPEKIEDTLDELENEFAMAREELQEILNQTNA